MMIEMNAIKGTVTLLRNGAMGGKSAGNTACAVLKKVHRIRLDIQARDGIGCAPYTYYHGSTMRAGRLYFAGSKHASYLLLPIIPFVKIELPDEKRTIIFPALQ